MLFWIVTGALVGIVALGMALALLRARSLGTAQDFDMALYRGQLAEVERDVARGVLAASEAETARTEIKRRILEADRMRGRAVTGAAAPKAAMIAALAFGGLVLAGGVALYTHLGQAGRADEPLALRLALAKQSYESRPAQEAAETQAASARGPITADPRMETLLVQLRAAVEKDPKAEEGLRLLAQNEGAVGNFRAAWQAQERLIALKGAAATAGDYTILADLLIEAAGGLVTAQAEDALTEALARDPQNAPARFYAGLMMAQNGRPDETFKIWAQLLAEGPQDAPWNPPIRGSIEELAWLAGVENYQAPEGGKGPDAAAVQAADEMSPQARQEMIAGMVAGLEERLFSAGGSSAEWAQLIRALSVLGDGARLEAGLAKARAALAQDPDGLADVERAAQ